MASLFPMYAFSAPSGELPLYTDVAMDFEAGTPRWESGNPVLVTGPGGGEELGLAGHSHRPVPLARL